MYDWQNVTNWFDSLTSDGNLMSKKDYIAFCIQARACTNHTHTHNHMYKHTHTRTHTYKAINIFGCLCNKVDKKILLFGFLTLLFDFSLNLWYLCVFLMIFKNNFTLNSKEIALHQNTLQRILNFPENHKPLGLVTSYLFLQK